MSEKKFIPAVKGSVRKELSTKFFLHGYTIKSDAFAMLENEYLNGYPPYDSLEQFIKKIVEIVLNKLPTDSSFIDKDFANNILTYLQKSKKGVRKEIAHDLVLKNVNHEEKNAKETHQLHAKFLTELCNKFLEKLAQANDNDSFEIKNILSVITTYKGSVNCYMFGFLKRNIQKINEYILEDETGSVAVEFTNETEYRNSILLENSFVLIEGLFHSLANTLYAQKIGYLPATIHSVQNDEEEEDNVQIENLESNMFVILREVYLDDRKVLEKLKLLLSGYNSVEPTPHFFIFIGPFVKSDMTDDIFADCLRFFFKLIGTCDRLSSLSQFIFVPGVAENDTDFVKPPIDNEVLIINGKKIDLKVHLSTNPVNLYINGKHICVFSSNYFAQIKKNIINKKVAIKNQWYQDIANVIISNAHLTPGLKKTFHNSCNLFHMPNLIIFADIGVASSEHFCFQILKETRFLSLPSFSNNDYQFKVYYSDSSMVEDSQISF